MLDVENPRTLDEINADIEEANRGLLIMLIFLNLFLDNGYIAVLAKVLATVEPEGIGRYD